MAPYVFLKIKMSKQNGQGLIDWLFAHIDEEAIDKERMFRTDGRYYNTNTLMPGLFALCFSGIGFLLLRRIATAEILIYLYVSNLTSRVVRAFQG